MRAAAAISNVIDFDFRRRCLAEPDVPPYRHRNMAWAQKQIRARRAKGPVQALLLIGFALDADERGGVIDTQENLARALPVCLRTLRKHLALMRENGLITMEPQFDAADGGQCGNLYRLALEG